MAHKTLINGTAYEIDGGKTLVNGTAYEVDKGKTLVGGTAYEVSFEPPDTKLIVNSDLYTASNGEYISASDNPRIAYTVDIGTSDVYFAFGEIYQQGFFNYWFGDAVRVDSGQKISQITVGKNRIIKNTYMSITDKNTGEVHVFETNFAYQLQKGHTYELRVTEK